MSSYNDYLAASNNSVNDNKVNSKRARCSVQHQIKQLLKPIFALLKKNKNTYRKNAQPEFYVDESDENLANELLENRIFEEIDSCPAFSAVPVYHEGMMDIVPIFRGERYIPVHFAKTEAGTFFWTSMVGADCDIAYDVEDNVITEKQLPQIQVPCDRWAQA